jgi:gamma-glutamylcyclotransferase (GGCT)/AIG2-like uncharacterized protein YtfP
MERRTAGGRDGESLAAPLVCELNGYRRTWNVAMDNAQTIPGYKLYVDAATGARGDWFVTFLNVVRDERASVNGVLFEVTPRTLQALDQRERNYSRIEVSADLDQPVDGEVWVYAGAAAAVRRFELGHRTGRAVVPSEYRRQVAEDFAAVGPGHRERFIELTDPPPCPVVDLRRIDLPLAVPRTVRVPVTASDHSSPRTRGIRSRRRTAGLR